MNHSSRRRGVVVQYVSWYTEGTVFDPESPKIRTKKHMVTTSPQPWQTTQSILPRKSFGVQNKRETIGPFFVCQLKSKVSLIARGCLLPLGNVLWEEWTKQALWYIHYIKISDSSLKQMTLSVQNNQITFVCVSSRIDIFICFTHRCKQVSKNDYSLKNKIYETKQKLYEHYCQFVVDVRKQSRSPTVRHSVNDILESWTRLYPAKLRVIKRLLHYILKPDFQWIRVKFSWCRSWTLNILR